MTTVRASPLSLVWSTLRALVDPRRSFPILFGCVPLVLLQWQLSDEPLAAPLGVVFCLSFVLTAPLAWRVFVPDGVLGAHRALGVILYGASGVTWVVVFGRIVPEMLGMAPTLLTLDSSLVVCGTLFLVGGWGLGRDIAFETNLVREQQRAVLLEREAERAQLHALRSHLDPHFVFNTLNAIAEWCREDGEVAERAVLRLSQILRSMLAGVKTPTWPLATELELVHDLFELHLLRDPELFTLDWDVPSPAPDVSLPPLLLLPIAENAIKHGPAAGHHGVVRLGVAIEPEGLRLTLANPGRYA